MNEFQFFTHPVCGITGIFSNHPEAIRNPKAKEQVQKAMNALHHRGPDKSGIYSGENCLLGHQRLSIVDTSSASDQPFLSRDGRYAMVYNGEIFNFKELRKAMEEKGISFQTPGDTEVVLQLYIHEGAAAIGKLNGFFAIAIYDSVEKSLFVARDRYGMKPLLYSYKDETFYFASELKALMNFPRERKLDKVSLMQYLQLNYVPAPHTMLEDVKKFPAGTSTKLKWGEKDFVFKRYCNEPFPCEAYRHSYTDAKKTFINLLDDSVRRRLIADVPLGTFLSGGLDSSAVTAIAARYKPDLMTFSIGYKNEPMFDESRYAELVSRKLKTQHHAFMLDNNDLYEDLYRTLDSLDEPFGDSSAIPMHILSGRTRKYVKVALSGDGGDELLGGYNKHLAEVKLRSRPFLKHLAATAMPFLKLIPKSRNGAVANLARKGSKFAEGAAMDMKERYWRWASIATLKQVSEIINKEDGDRILYSTEAERRNEILNSLNTDFNSLLFTDLKMVLQNDMLVKTDLMSMANSLEVRMPLLDYRLVDFCFSLPASFKITMTEQKKILRETMAPFLPAEILQRRKHGFEVPLLKWFKTDLRSAIESEWLNEEYIKEQGLFDPAEIKKLKQQLYSASPQDAVARVWGLIAFQSWYKKYF